MLILPRSTCRWARPSSPRPRHVTPHGEYHHAHAAGAAGAAGGSIRRLEVQKRVATETFPGRQALQAALHRVRTAEEKLANARLVAVGLGVVVEVCGSVQK